MFISNIFKKIRERRGTTLVEMMIAFSVFGILIAITVSSFKQSLELQQLSTMLLEAHDSVGLLFEQISREVRTSGTDERERLSATPDSITFMHQDGYEVTYALSGGEITRSVDGQTPEPVTSSNANIQIERFSPSIINPGTDYQRLVMTIETVVTDRRGLEYPSIIQTTISPRFYE